jgi:uncharacterized membrane-anchored protein YitT (DUF2179 family)
MIKKGLKKNKRTNIKKVILKKIELTIGIFLVAISFNLFFLPMKLVVGGTTGIAIIGEHLFGLSPSLTAFIYSFIVLLLGYFALGLKEIIRSIYGSFVYPFAIGITAAIGQFYPIDQVNALLTFIIGGVSMGVAFGIIFKTGYTTGGGDIIRQILNKYFGMTIGRAGLIVNGIIVLLGGLFFGWTKVMYAIVTLYIMGKVTDRTLLGTSKSKAFYIVTDKDEEIKDFILKNLNVGVSILKAKKGRSGIPQNVLMCVVPTKQYFELKEGIGQIDKDVFFVTADAYEVKGGT